ncbi:MAG: hypothetical protein V7K50_15650 [Nostoc sp.]|uniref:hypothetical protein n=1 Tax=Nostoc sp. TaxID=1180 RepID=UPI002FF59F55
MLVKRGKNVYSKHSVNLGRSFRDIIKNSGVQALVADGDFTTVKDAVDFHLRQLADYLIHGNGAILWKDWW